MKLSLNWLATMVELPATPAALAEVLTAAGVEVERIERRGCAADNVVVGEVLAAEKHPNADRLTVCRVAAGEGAPRQIVCGAKNFRVGDKVPLALPGAVLPGDLRIRTGKLRGVESQGMMCSGRELGLSDEADGLLILPAGSPVGAPFSQVMPPDTSIEIEVTPNRPDLLGYCGVAREIAALTGNPAKLPAPAQMPPAGDGGIAVAVRAAANCPFYSARRIAGVRVGPSPQWLRDRLEAAGVRPINSVVDVTNFVLLETGQPLHAFDGGRMAGGIVVRQAVADEELLALDGRIYRLGAEDLVIADRDRPVALAGVMGGEETGVGEGTADVIIESALFRPGAIRRTARRLGMMTDSSYRFERGVDPAGVLAASQRAVELILEIAGGTPAAGASVAGALPPVPAVIPFRPDRCRALLGAAVDGAEMAAVLGRLGLVRERDGWRPPSYRGDLTREIDLIEEVGRVLGMERIPARAAGRFSASSATDRVYDERLRLRRRLVAHGFFEARTLTLVADGAGQEEGAPVAVDGGGEAGDGGGGSAATLRVRNPLSAEHAVLRAELLPNLLAVVARNVCAGSHDLRLFELGRVFAADGSEPDHLALAMTGGSEPVGWRSPRPRPVDFHDLKGVIEGLGIEGVRMVAAKVPGYAVAAAIWVGERLVGRGGQIAPGRARRLDVALPLLVAEIDLTGVGLADVARRRVGEMARFPAVRRDIALVVSGALPQAEIEGRMWGANEPLLVGVELFDLFTDPAGEKVAAGKKSLAYSLTYRAADRTLTAVEANAAHARVKESVAGLGVVFRE